MRTALLSLLFLLLSFPAWAASCPAAERPCNCIAVVSFDEGAADEFPFRISPWSGITTLQDRLMSLPIAAVHVYYTQFGVQGGPTAEDFSGVTKSELGLLYIPPTRDQPREQLVVGKFDPDPSRTQHQGTTAHYIAALDDTEDVSIPCCTNRNGPEADHVLLGSQLNHGIGIIDEAAGTTAVGIGSRSGEIWAEIIANGCP